jgi:hypothetical protein
LTYTTSGFIIKPEKKRDEEFRVRARKRVAGNSGVGTASDAPGRIKLFCGRE